MTLGFSSVGFHQDSAAADADADAAADAAVIGCEPVKGRAAALLGHRSLHGEGNPLRPPRPPPRHG